jgi:hypothetical protein
VPLVSSATIWRRVRVVGRDTISVSGVLRAYSCATAIALSNAIVSPICAHALAAWSCLSIEAPSTCRKKPSRSP